VIEETGRSWIEVDQTLHPFYASDLSHPWREEVFLKVKEFLVKFKEAGYVSDDQSYVYMVWMRSKEKNTSRP
jgi:hypothetical protein